MYAANTVGARDNMGTMGTREILRAWPVAENFVPHFRLPSAEMDTVQTSDYHKLRSWVIVFAGEYNPSTSPGLLSDLAGHYSEVARKSAEVLVVVKGTPAEAALFKKRYELPFPVLADEDGQVHRDYGATALNGRSPCEAVYVTGRFGKVYLSSRACDGPPLPDASGILSWLYFIEAQCPLCGLDEPLL